MTILQSLANRYARLSLTGEAPAAGFAPAPISFAIILDQEGHYVTTQDERVSDGRKLRTKTQLVPALPKRTIGIASGAFWDKTSYVLGRTALDGQLSAANQAKSAKRLNKEHAAFLARHERLLDGTSDIGCTALLTFLRQWSPEHYETLKDAEAMLDQNVAFRLAGAAGFMHDRIAARAALLAETVVPDVLPEAMCLVTGEVAPIARLHPLIKGVAGAQPWGAALVSFNLDSCTSYGKIQGANAPVSQAAAFAYGTVLNGLLTTSSINAKGRPIYPNRVSLGETTVAFWAEYEDTENIARSVISHEGDGLSLNDVLPIDEETETVKLSDVLHKMQDGDPLRDAAPEMDPASRVYVLGLSPNVARLSVRFWVEQSLGDFARHFQQHWADLRLDPLPHPWPPSLWRLLLELVPHRNPENIPPRLTGDVMRSILSGHPYPRTLLIQTIMRIRIDRDEEDPRTGRLLERVSSLRVALLKACLTRMHRWKLIAEEVPVSLDLTTTNSAYRLGRLFSVLEHLQRAALGQRNATVRDRFYASASATPTLVFPSLLRNARNHSRTIRTKVGVGLAEWFEDHIADIASGIDSKFPRTLTLEEQGRFALGYYHQRDGFRRKKDVPIGIEAALPDGSLEQE